jgi:hypothetical protein
MRLNASQKLPNERLQAMQHESWKELFADEEHGGPLVPILALAHEHDPDPEMRPYKDNIDAERRDKLILGISGGVKTPGLNTKAPRSPAATRV